MKSLIIALLLICLDFCSASTSPKRGLVYVPNQKYPGDDKIWDKQPSDLTWYYTYASQPIDQHTNARWNFVPMLWDVPSIPGAFKNNITTAQARGVNITHVLAFNEPDGTSATGGTAIDPSTAASVWIREMEPLKAMGIKLGAPVTQGNDAGVRWLSSFMTSCNGNCTVDFIPIHCYSDFTYFASYIGQVYATFGEKPLWVTEFALPDASLQASQMFYNQSTNWLDNLTWVERYSYFGSFRSSVSNVGPDAAMLTQNGKLTDIGSWYLGGGATGNVPKGGAVRERMSLSLCTILFTAWIYGSLL